MKRILKECIHPNEELYNDTYPSIFGQVSLYVTVGYIIFF